MDASTTRLHLRVSPGASHSGVVGRHGPGWKVRIAAPPERGRANEALVELLAATLDVPRADVVLVSGASSRDKTVAVRGLGAAQTEARLAAAVGGGR